MRLTASLAAIAVSLGSASCARSPGAAAAAATPAGRTLPAPDARVAAIVRAVSARQVEANIRTLVSFGTRHTRSDTLSLTRGIGAARRWIKGRFDSLSTACGGCLEVSFVGEVIGPPAPRMPEPTNVVSVVAVQRGATDPDRVVIISGHFDSRAGTDANVTDSAPGANDDGSGTAAVLEAARVLSQQRFGGTIVYAALAGEEQGLFGGQIVARWVRSRGWRVVGVLNNDIIGNTRGADGAADDRTVRVFSDGVPPTEYDTAAVRRRRLTGGDVDGISRQLARYVERIQRRYVPELDVWMVYRLDRYGRGGDHRPFADLGFPAVRITEAHEDWTRQHQDIRVEDGIQYGDLPDAVNFTYAARITALNAAALASLSWAPAPPRAVRIGGGGRPSAVLSWQMPEDSASVAGFRVYWRRTDSPTWDHWADVGRVTTHTFTNLVIDNWFFGVASLSGEGNESPVVFPSGAQR